MHQCHLVPPALSPGRLKKRAFDETLSRGPVSGPKPRPKPSCFCCLTKLRIIPPSMAVKKKTARRSLDLADKAEGTMTKYYWAFARGGAWRNPKPTGGPYVCEQCRLDACGGNDTTLTHAGCHNNRAGPCGRLRRMRCAVVGGTGGQRLSKTPPPNIGWHYSPMEGAVTLLSGGTHTSSVCTSWKMVPRAHCE